jgi:hypothetical protein
VGAGSKQSSGLASPDFSLDKGDLAPIQRQRQEKGEAFWVAEWVAGKAIALLKS